jgi:hypothetical protein
VIPLQEAHLHPLTNAAAPGRPYPGGADVLFDLNIGLSPEGLFTINDVSFSPPSVPVLLQILSGSRQASELLPKGSVFPLPPNKVVEVSIPAYGAIGGPVSTRYILTPAMLIYIPTACFPSPRSNYFLFVATMYLTAHPAYLLCSPKCRHRHI